MHHDKSRLVLPNKRARNRGQIWYTTTLIMRATTGMIPANEAGAGGRKKREEAEDGGSKR